MTITTKKNTYVEITWTANQNVDGYQVLFSVMENMDDDVPKFSQDSNLIEVAVDDTKIKVVIQQSEASLVEGVYYYMLQLVNKDNPERVLVTQSGLFDVLGQYSIIPVEDKINAGNITLDSYEVKMFDGDNNYNDFGNWDDSYVFPTQ